MNHYNRINLSFVVGIIITVAGFMFSTTNIYKMMKLINVPTLSETQVLMNGTVVKALTDDYIGYSDLKGYFEDFDNSPLGDTYLAVKNQDEYYLVVLTDISSKNDYNKGIIPTYYTTVVRSAEVEPRYKNVDFSMKMNKEYILYNVNVGTMKFKLNLSLIAFLFGVYKLVKAKHLFIQKNKGSTAFYADEYKHVLNLESEIEREQMMLKNYQQKEQKMEQWTRRGIVMMIAGILFCLADVWIIVKVGSFIIFLLGLEETYQGFINSDTEWGRKYAHFFGLSSIQFQKEECVERIYTIENLLRKKRSEEKTILYK